MRLWRHPSFQITMIVELGLDHHFGHLPPGVETPGYYPPSLQDGKSPIGAADNSPAIYCRVDRTMIKALISFNEDALPYDLLGGNILGFTHSEGTVFPDKWRIIDGVNPFSQC